MADILLQESDATVVMFDLRGFAALAARLSPVDLGAALSRFYDHAEAIVLGEQGKVLKFTGDIVTAVWLVTDVQDHRAGAVAAVRAASAKQRAWQAENAKFGMPDMSYSVAAATGRVLAGHIGTDRMRAFDVLGEPASIAAKLTPLATVRGIDNLVTSECLDAAGGRLPGVETEGFEVGGRRLRLYHVT
jgi:class 3 adenylate cyclase